MIYPEMTKTNARFRGPRESKKQSDAVLDIQHSIARLRKQFERRKEASGRLLEGLVTQYQLNEPLARQEISDHINSVKGGEL